jgi:hypothetical protein
MAIWRTVVGCIIAIVMRAMQCRRRTGVPRVVVTADTTCAEMVLQVCSDVGGASSQAVNAKAVQRSTYLSLP